MIPGHEPQLLCCQVGQQVPLNISPHLLTRTWYILALREKILTHSLSPGAARARHPSTTLLGKQSENSPQEVRT